MTEPVPVSSLARLEPVPSNAAICWSVFTLARRGRGVLPGPACPDALAVNAGVTGGARLFLQHPARAGHPVCAAPRQSPALFHKQTRLAVHRRCRGLSSGRCASRRKAWLDDRTQTVGGLRRPSSVQSVARG